MALRFSLSFKILTGTAIVLTLTMAISYYVITKTHEDLIFQYLHNQARSLFKQITLTRRWVTEHGGLVLPGTDSDRTSSGNPNLIDETGKRSLRGNPASIIKELSKYAEKEGLYWFRTTSLQLTNPENKPDDFEMAALMKFEGGGMKEVSKIDTIGQKSFYRYIAPLYIEQTCLDCHDRQGYQVGDVRGALSIAIAMDFSDALIRTERKGMVLTIISTILTLMLILFIMMKKLVISPVDRIKSSIRDFSAEEKPEVALIRTGDELEDLSMSFVAMSESLKAYNVHLEDMVHAATKDLEEANEKLIALNRRKSDFVAKVSHELRTPLTSIKGAMDYLSAKFALNGKTDYDVSELMTFITVIKNNAERIVRMVNNTLDLERIESGALDMHFSHVTILDLIKDVVTSFQSIASGKKITFRLVSDPRTVVLADEDRIGQVMINLISNAVQVSRHESEIAITVEDSEAEVSVSVIDQGPGIPPEEHEKIFNKFYTRGTKDGSGLGLPICKGIIEAHKGTLTVANNPDGSGSTFTFTLPRTGKDI